MSYSNVNHLSNDKKLKKQSEKESTNKGYGENFINALFKDYNKSGSSSNNSDKTSVKT